MEHRQEIERLTAAIEASPEDMTLYAERGKIHFRAHDFGSALNDFNRVLLAEEHNEEIRQYVKMINEILVTMIFTTPDSAGKDSDRPSFQRLFR